MKHQNNSVTSTQDEIRTHVIENYLMDYCSKTTIHGVRYFVERKRHWTERCWWVIAICLSMWFCGSSIRNIWVKWRDNPVTMSLNERLLPIPTVPFPTITICPEIKTHKEKLDFTALYGLELDEWDVSCTGLSRIKALSHLCVDVWKEFINSHEYFVNASVFDLIEDMAPNLNETVFSCDWTYEGDTCSDIFVPILTEEGLCFAFNYLNSNDIYTENMAPEMLTIADRPNMSDWSLEDGYIDVSNKSSYPIHVYSSQKNVGLKFSLRSEDVDVEYICRTLVPGFQIYMHSPGDVLKSSDVSIRVPFSEEVQISIKPRMITTAKGLRKYAPSQRQCYFDSESRLRFFKFYSQENCETECLANYTVQECGCVKFSMPRNDSTNICGPAKIGCYKLAYRKLFEEDIVDGLSNADAKSFRMNCDCMPSCTTITYDAEVDRAKFDWRKALTRTLNYTNDDLQWLHVSRVSIFFDSYQIASLRREEQYTNTDFLAICGGLLGLCLGVSALSIIEFIYYSTLRLFWSLRKWKSDNKAIPNRSANMNHVYINIPTPVRAWDE